MCVPGARPPPRRRARGEAVPTRVAGRVPRGRASPLRPAPRVAGHFGPSDFRRWWLDSIHDPEVGMRSGEAAPPSVDAVYARRAGSPLSPAVELADRDLLAFREHLDGAVVAVLHPSGDSEPPGFSLGCSAEVDSLNPTIDVELQLLECHAVSAGEDTRAPGRRHAAAGPSPGNRGRSAGADLRGPLQTSRRRS